MGLLELLSYKDPMEGFYRAVAKNPVTSQAAETGGVTGAAFQSAFPHGLGNLLFGRDPQPTPQMDTPEGTQFLTDLASNMYMPGTFIGPKGMGNLLGDDAARAMLAQAESKLASGVPREQVFSEFGVFKGPEGKWRYEIDDTGAGFKSIDDWSWGARTGLKQGESRVSDPLGVMVRHQELEKAYPDGFFDFGNENKRLLAEVNTNAIDSGSFDGTTVSVGMKDGRPNDSTLLHELQHAVQEREGFARGGSPEGMRDMFPDFQAINDAQVMSAIVENRGVPIDDAPAEFLNMLGRDSHPEARVLLRQHANNFRDLFSYPSSEFNAYQRLAGEAEARAVQDRMNMSMDERRALFPEYATRDDLIIRGLGGGMMSLLGGAQ